MGKVCLGGGCSEVSMKIETVTRQNYAQFVHETNGTKIKEYGGGQIKECMHFNEKNNYSGTLFLAGYGGGFTGLM